MRSSFKVRLTVYFLLLAALPLSAAFWGFGAVTKRAEERRVDTRLAAELRAAMAVYRGELAELGAGARNLASRPRVQQLLVHRRSRRLEIGRRAGIVATRVVRVRGGSRVLGTIVATLPLDEALLRRVGHKSGLAASDRLLLVRRAANRRSRGAFVASLSGSDYRALSSPLPGQPRLELAVLAPSATIARTAGATQRHLFFVLAAALLVLAAIATFEGRSVMRSLKELTSAARALGEGELGRRVPIRGRDEFAQLAQAFNGMAAQLRARLRQLEHQRGRLRESLNRIGELLVATHDVEQLLPVIASAALETAGARGAILISEEGIVVEVGELDGAGERLELPITAGDAKFGILVLEGSTLGKEELAATRSLVAQAGVALENARLHKALEVQATSDPLTGLANRRRSEEFLATEVARSERYQTPLALILGDIDGFKAANDSHGHAFGDVILREFAAVLVETLRDVDLAGRWGGEEFLVVLPGTDLAGALEAAERIRATFADRAFRIARDAETAITVSFGVSEHWLGMDKEALVSAADDALYAAKRGGRNRVEAASGETPVGGGRSHADGPSRAFRGRGRQRL